MTTFTCYPVADTPLRRYSVYEARNYGKAINNSYSGLPVLFRFDLSSIPSNAEIVSAYIRLVKVDAPQGISYNATTAFYEVSDANGDWVEGTKNGTTAGAGEPCWDAKEANGSGGVTTAWAGSEGCSTAGTDYVNTLLASKTTDWADAQYTAYQIDFNAAGLAVLKSWFGETTNNGLVKILYVNESLWGMREQTNEAYRPLLSVTYTEGSGGIPKHYLHYARLRSN